MTQTTTVRARRAAVQAGMTRGWIEIRQSVTGLSFIAYLAFPAIYAAVLWFLRDSSVPGTGFALGTMVLPSLVGMSIAFGGFLGPASTMVIDREDGTLLRAKATPNGMLGYLVGKFVLIAGSTLLSLALMVIPGIMVAGDLHFDAWTWLLLALIFVLGMTATVPVGAVLGSLLRSPAQSSLLFVASLVLIMPSGIFSPITTLPQWQQWVGQAFPYYWLGLGARSALLPAEMAVVEIGGSWRTLETIAVLGVWTVAGLSLAPSVLRRMARRQSGSAVNEARERFLRQGY